uniref:Uncharacterized protein n=2 Tax=Arion vulgaris TaxID=1028688 RepID=A0A0B6ZIM5_9EUPU
MPEEHTQLKGEYMTSEDQATMDQTGSGSHFLHPDVLAQHRSHMAASSSVQSSSPSLMLSSSSSSSSLSSSPFRFRRPGFLPRPPPELLQSPLVEVSELDVA